MSAAQGLGACRGQPERARAAAGGLAAAAAACRRRLLPPLPSEARPPSPPSPLRSRRRQVRRVRLVRAACHAGAHLRRVQLRVVRGALRDLRRHRRVGRILLQGVHHSREGRECSTHLSATIHIYICFSCCVLGRRESVRTEVGFTKWVLVSGRCTPFLAAPNCFTHSASIAASGKWQLYRNGCCFTSAAAAAAVAAGDAADCQAPRCPPCVQRDGCPKIINLGSAKTDLFYVSEGASAVRCCACPAGVVRCAGTHASRGRSVDSQHAAATEPSKPARGQPTGSGGLPPACRRRLRAAAAWSATCPLLS